MVKEAEKFKAEDEQVKHKLESVNNFEALLYQTKSALDNKELSDKLSEDDRNTITEVVEDSEKWFDINRDSCTKEEIDSKYSELQGKLMPIMTKLQGGTTTPDMNNENVPSEPTIDEVD